MPKITVQGIGDVNLTDKDFITSGGEGMIYGRGDTIYKLYIEPKNMIPPGKIKELSVLTNPSILKPKNLISDKTGNVIGFTMNWVKNNVPTVKLFTNDFRNRFSIDLEKTKKFILNSYRVLQHLHDHRCLMVDVNEFNILADLTTFENPYFIDVNSYQTPNYPATAIMMSIKDFHSKAFSELTDWFSFGVITFQLFVGIHPFKGTHPDFKRGDIENRMKSNVSVFNSNVKMPAAIRPIDDIPATYKEWYINLFEKGLRSAPPLTMDAKIIVNIASAVKSGDRIMITLVKKFEDISISKFYNIGITQIAVNKTKSEYVAYVKNHKYTLTKNYPNVMLTPISLTPICAEINNDILLLTNLKTNEILYSATAQQMYLDEGTLYYINNDRLIEVLIYEQSSKIIITSQSSWNVLPNASTVWDGAVSMNVLGKFYLVIPYRFPGKPTSCFMKEIPEITGLKILEIKRRKNVCIIITHNNNTYNRNILRFNKDFTEYEHSIISDIDYVGSPNFIVLDNGNMVYVTEENSIEVSNKQSTIAFADKLPTNAKLWTDGGTVYFSNDNELYSITVKK